MALAFTQPMAVPAPQDEDELMLDIDMDVDDGPLMEEDLLEVRTISATVPFPSDKPRRRAKR